MERRDVFTLTREQVDFLRRKYASVEIVRKALEGEKDCAFDIDLDDGIDFYDWLDTESVMTMVDDEPTDDTYVIEGIIDSIYYQTKDK